MFERRRNPADASDAVAAAYVAMKWPGRNDAAGREEREDSGGRRR